ncbi:MAG TPA: SigB/SigF/SigG family RNA polymerase sigma factor [Thermoleophilaceae bacterium]
MRRYQTAHDLGARDELVRKYLPLIRSLAKRYSYTSEPLDDLCQVGAMALCKAIERYRPGGGASFKAYAVPTIVGELRRHFRDTGWALHIPRSLQERSRHVGNALNQLSAQLGRSPTIAELAEAAGLSREDVIEGLDVRMAYDTAPLDAPGQSDDTLTARLGAEDAALEAVEYHAVLERTMRALPERERMLLHLRFSEDLSQSEIARRVGVSQMHVSRLLRRAVGRLQAAAAADEARFGAITAG